MKKRIDLFSVEQPIGVFYIGKMFTNDLLSTYYVQRRSLNYDGIQRDLNNYRSLSIMDYIDDPDATFPTSIILSVESNRVNFVEKNNNLYVEFNNAEKELFEIIDGQHRISGLEKNPDKVKELPVVLLFDLSQEDKAYIFSVINSNQKQVNKSYIYDLFDVHTSKSPNKTCHNIAKTLNSDIKSPFYRKIKMLGKRKEISESLSQGAFVSELSKLITKDSDKDERDIKLGRDKERLDDSKFIFRELFFDDNEALIYKIVFNYFSAVKDVFENEWNESKTYILSKTTGYGALCKSLPTAYKYCLKTSDFTFDNFKVLFEETKNYFINNKLDFTSNKCGVGEQAQKKLVKHFIASWQSIIEQ